MTVKTHCPAVNVPIVEPCDPAEVEPLLEWLASGEAVSEPTAFPRGTALPDGRLDLCKQSLGPDAAARVIAAIAGNPHVTSVLLGTDAIGAPGARAMAALVTSGASALETLYLGCNTIAGDQVAPLTEAVADSSAVRALWLKRNPLGVTGASHVARLLESGGGLEVLDLFNAELGDDGVALLASALADNPTLRALDIGGNGLSVAGCEALGEALATNTALEDLRLPASAIGDEGVAAIARGLRQNRHLARLDVASCDIGPTGADALFDALAEHPSIELVDLRRFPAARALEMPANHIGNDATAARTLLAHAPSLRHLDLRDAGMASPGALVLERALADRWQVSFLGFARFVSRRIRRRIRVLLDRNIEAGAEPVGDPGYVDAIRSVYR